MINFMQMNHDRMVPVEILLSHIVPFMDVHELGPIWDALEFLATDHPRVWSVTCYEIVQRDVWKQVVHVPDHHGRPYHEILEFSLYCIVPRMISNFRPGLGTREKLATLDRFLADVRSYSILTPGTLAVLIDTPSWRRTALVYNSFKAMYPDITGWQ